MCGRWSWPIIVSVIVFLWLFSLATYDSVYSNVGGKIGMRVYSPSSPAARHPQNNGAPRYLPTNFERCITVAGPSRNRRAAFSTGVDCQTTEVIVMMDDDQRVSPVVSLDSGTRECLTAREDGATFDPCVNGHPAQLWTEDPHLGLHSHAVWKPLPVGNGANSPLNGHPSAHAYMAAATPTNTYNGVTYILQQGERCMKPPPEPTAVTSRSFIPTDRVNMEPCSVHSAQRFHFLMPTTY